MEYDVYEQQVTNIVRDYSNEIAGKTPKSVLEQAMAAHDAKLQQAELSPPVWRDWLRFEAPEPDPDVGVLQSEAKAANQLWRSLKLDIGELGGSEDEIPSVQTLWTAVHDAQSKWTKKSEKGFGRAKAKLFSFLETMDSHKYLFSVIPDGDKYISLITGIVTTVASVNHEAMADGFSQALQDISRDINFVRRGTQLCNSAEMKRLVVSLYKEVFAFLCHSMKWYSSAWNRFKKAFDTHFYDKNVQQRVKTIQGLVQRVRDEMSLMNDRLVQDMHSEQRTGFNEIKNHIDRGLDARFERLAQVVGAQMGETLKANAQHQFSILRASEVLLEGKMKETEDVRSSQEPSCITRTELEKWLPTLAPFTVSPRSAASKDTSNIPTIPNEVAIDIQQWLQTPKSDILWVEGPAYGPFDQTLSSIGVRIQSATEEVGINCIGFFAKTAYPFESELQFGSVKSAGIISMMYSIIGQLISIAPSSIPNSPDLSESRMGQLDGSLETIPASLDILRTLLSHMDPGLVIVICGFNLVDSRENLPHLTKFVEILRDQPLERRVKTLFISAGNCRALAGSIDRSQRSDASRLTLARPQRPLPDGVDVGSIRL